MHSSFMHISDNLLIETYKKAQEFKLDPNFIQIILEEIKQRNLTHLIEEQKSET
ncbi:sporulation histidine kinase inhibitor Sda [Halalkalibacter urbisdiaboli]|uniref:sporulation histidine kinase inhibitor Sda n=1 Tax=Halalkalibacter urbisdiaboli TaxID=1960589 RepID=UPI001FD87CD0|nr:sporulation histidine kinase inhibitor Sda [Halalkalibacter urbisdiaboli]